MAQDDKEALLREIYAVVATIPEGTVVTYGQVAEQVGVGPRHVGQALAALPSGSDCPWHRVINAHGRVSVRPNVQEAEEVQRKRLEGEGVQFNDGKVDLSIFRWHPQV